ncbi:hypothetical protein V492_02929 [Pseudogymnoascus sp. VKM F-4246]|nr:hypothetical protein V492_02929 [Pseudogymnoascus sp. VKM F-4246]
MCACDDWCTVNTLQYSIYPYFISNSSLQTPQPHLRKTASLTHSPQPFQGQQGHPNHQRLIQSPTRTDRSSILTRLASRLALRSPRNHRLA